MNEHELEIEAFEAEQKLARYNETHTNKGSIAVDFDGVIHRYSRGWDRGQIYDDAIEGAFDFIRKMMDDGYSVFVFSTRSPRQIKRWIENSKMHGCIDYDESVYAMSPHTVQVIPFWTKFWNKKNVLGITNRKLPALIYIDDRAYKFDGSFDDLIANLSDK